MSTPREEFQKFLDAQRAEYRRALPEKIHEIHTRWKALAASAEVTHALQELQRLTHSMAGTAGTLGFRDVGLAAKALELLLEEAGERGPTLTAEHRAAIVSACDVLLASLPAPAAVS